MPGMKPATSFKQVWEEIEEEARQEGPEAVEQLEDFQEAFRYARALSSERKKKGLSQTQVARISGINQSEISKIESGSANPTMQTLTRLLDTYGLQMKFVPKANAVTTYARRGTSVSSESRPGKKSRKMLVSA
jgi:DNA-binding phage protein